jgi:hypothetical protein
MDFEDPESKTTGDEGQEEKTQDLPQKWDIKSQGDQPNQPHDDSPHYQQAFLDFQIV